MPADRLSCRNSGLRHLKTEDGGGIDGVPEPSYHIDDITGPGVVCGRLSQLRRALVFAQRESRGRLGR